jgi:hypothetical protein
MSKPHNATTTPALEPASMLDSWPCGVFSDRKKKKRKGGLNKGTGEGTERDGW